jgi:hypothetical protein
VGKISVTSKGLAASCVVACQLFPSWLFVLAELRLQPTLVVILQNDVYLGVVQLLVPVNCQILVGRDDTSSQIINKCGSTTIGLVDGALTSDLSAVFEGLGVRKVYCTRRMRRKVPGWDNVNGTIDHAAVGGVTTHTLRFGVLCKDEPQPSDA